MALNRSRLAAITVALACIVAPAAMLLPGSATQAAPVRYPLDSPAGFSATSPSSTSLHLSWKANKRAYQYRVQASTTKSFSKATTLSQTFTMRKDVLAGLAPGTTYYLRIRSLGASGRNLSAYSSKITATTAPAVAVTNGDGSRATVRVGSYNIRCVNCTGGPAGETSWYYRRDAVIDTILDQKVDVLGAQEAAQAWLRAKNGRSDKKINVTQFEDLIKRLGAPYALTNTQRNNCANSFTPSNCKKRDQGASEGSRIIYNTDTMQLIDQGSKKLDWIAGGDNDRYVAWAIFQHRASGKQFFFADTQLEHKKGKDYFELRQQQTRTVLDVVADNNPRQLPAIVVGDFNSHKWTYHNDDTSQGRDNAPRTIMLRGGFVDPLGNYDGSTRDTQGAIVQSRIRTEYSSWNNYERVAKQSPGYVNGTYLDYIFTSTGIGVAQWETVLRLDDSGKKLVGKIPSDHNMIRATVEIP